MGFLGPQSNLLQRYMGWLGTCCRSQGSGRFCRSCLLPLLKKCPHFLDILCTILWFLQKLMLSVLWKTSQNGWGERALWRTPGPTTSVFSDRGIACKPGCQRSDISCLPFVLVCSLMSTLVPAWAHSKFFQLSDLAGHLENGARSAVLE